MKTFASQSLLVLGLVAALSGCMELSPETVGKQSNGQICYTIAVARANNGSAETIATGVDELRRRGELRETDLFAIQTGELRVGLREAAALCIIGMGPDAVNTITTARGVERQYVFNRPYNDVRPVTYIYTRDGTVTAFQD